MDLLKEFLEQLIKLQTVWIPFVLANFIVGLVVWRVLKHHYHGRLDSNAELLRLREAQLQDYKDKLSGATPDEARARMDALEARLKVIEPRALTSAQKEKLTAAMKPFEGGHIQIDADTSVADSQRLQSRFLQAFSKANWNISSSTVHELNAEQIFPTGLVVGLPNPEDPSLAERTLMTALAELGLSFDLTSDHRGGIRITVTHRQVR